MKNTNDLVRQLLDLCERANTVMMGDTKHDGGEPEGDWIADYEAISGEAHCSIGDHVYSTNWKDGKVYDYCFFCGHEPTKNEIDSLVRLYPESMEWVVETSYGVYSDRAWSFAMRADSQADAIRICEDWKWNMMRAYNNVTGEIINKPDTYLPSGDRSSIELRVWPASQFNADDMVLDKNQGEELKLLAFRLEAELSLAKAEITRLTQISH